MSRRKARPSLADMSLPPEDRGRKRKQKGAGHGVPAQMNHASGSKARRKRRDGEKKMAESR